MCELLLGSLVTDRATGQSGCVTGFYILLPGAEACAGRNGDQIAADSRAAGWFQEVSYSLARAARGFARVARTPNGAPFYWRLSSLKVNEEV